MLPVSGHDDGHCGTLYCKVPCIICYWMTENAMLSDSAQTQLRKGVLQLCVMAMLSRKESYAYEISSTLAEAVGMGESTIYPLMRRMQRDGLVVSHLVESGSGPSRKYYRLTDAGQREFEIQSKNWSLFMTAINEILGSKI